MVDLREAGHAVRNFEELLERTPEKASHRRVSPEAWTLAEIVGHLIDSAANNHQRFVRLRLGNLEGFPGYDTEAWIAAQGYDACDFRRLTALWASYNDLLLHLAATTPAEAAAHVWRSPDGERSLEFLIEDYYDHLRAHAAHYVARLDEVLATMDG